MPLFEDHDLCKLKPASIQLNTVCEQIRVTSVKALKTKTAMDRTYYEKQNTYMIHERKN